MNKCYFCKKEKTKLDIVLVDHETIAEVCKDCMYLIETETKNTCYICGKYSDCSNLETENNHINAICHLCSLKRIYKESDKIEK